MGAYGEALTLVFPVSAVRVGRSCFSWGLSSDLRDSPLFRASIYAQARRSWIHPITICLLESLGNKSCAWRAGGSLWIHFSFPLLSLPGLLHIHLRFLNWDVIWYVNASWVGSHSVERSPKTFLDLTWVLGMGLRSFSRVVDGTQDPSVSCVYPLACCSLAFVLALGTLSQGIVSCHCTQGNV